MIPIDLWSAEGRAEMRAHLDLIGEIEEAEAKLHTLRAHLPAWLDRQHVEGPPHEGLDWAIFRGGLLREHEEPAAQEDEKPAGEVAAEPAASEPAPVEAAENRDPERLWTPDLKAEAWAMAEEGFGVEDIAVKISIADHRVRTLLARIREGKHPVPGGAAAAPEAPAEAAPAEEPAPAAGDPADPERWIDDAMKAQIWRLDQEGYTPAAIAEEMSLAPRRVQNLLYRIRSGKHPTPGEPSTAVATTSTGGALVVPERGVARDPEMVQQWQDEMAEAERQKFVSRSEYPEMRA